MSEGLASSSRRRFLFGQRACLPDTVYPPWAYHLEQNCSRCGDCLNACPQEIISFNEHGFPVVDFHTGECTFCGECADVCADSVFDQSLPPWALQLDISGACFLHDKVYCRSCGDACPERAIQFHVALGGVTNLVIDADLCTGCGACVSSCPAQAITAKPGE
ncbi:MAG: ferredoxin-type protein NapF [Arenicellales bacterium WSBS_2016_MAG_OTU3]